jgi:hypothetical protein
VIKTTNGETWTPYDRMLGRSLYAENGVGVYAEDEGAAR